jgi:hypothetical protein
MGRRMFFWRNNIHPSRGKTKGYIAGRNRRRWIILFFLHEILLADFVCIILLIACRLCFTRIVVASKYVWKKKGKKSSSSSSLIDVSSSSSCVAERMCSWLRESTNPRVAYFILFFVFFFPGPCAETFKSENETADQLDSTHIATYSLCVCVCVCVCVERDMKKRGAAMKGLEKEVRFISFADHVPAPPSVHTRRRRLNFSWPRLIIFQGFFSYYFSFFFFSWIFS